MEKPILHLNLKKKWFDMIESGEKREEYREYKTYYHRLFVNGYVKIKGKIYHPSDVIICFSNGYAKTRRQMLFNLKLVYHGHGKPQWGAEKGKDYYVILLGERIYFI